MKKFVMKLSALTVICGVLFTALFCGVYFGIRGLYDVNYQKGFVYQYRALQNADPAQSKVIAIGTSAVTFSVDSAQLSEALGQPAYTLGINSGMGMSYIMETALKYARTGDTILFQFEPFSAHSYGTELILLSLDGEPELFWEFFAAHPMQVMSSAGAEIFTKLLQYATGSASGETGNVYEASSFDPATGNLTYPRPEPVREAQELSGAELLSMANISPETVQEVNTFARTCRERGITVYMLYVPYFREFIASTEAELASFQSDFTAAFCEAPLLLDIADGLFSYDQMYDGDMHLNDSGKTIYTALLAQKLMH